MNTVEITEYSEWESPNRDDTLLEQAREVSENLIRAAFNKDIHLAIDPSNDALIIWGQLGVAMEHFNPEESWTLYQAANSLIMRIVEDSSVLNAIEDANWRIRTEYPEDPYRVCIRRMADWKDFSVA